MPGKQAPGRDPGQGSRASKGRAGDGVQARWCDLAGYPGKEAGYPSGRARWPDIREVWPDIRQCWASKPRVGILDKDPRQGVRAGFPDKAP
ncbi:hypothetical protein Dimus_037298, partial [Dionaea muscipula]